MLSTRDNSVSAKIVSVIVPVYNVERYLNRCIHSITRQTYENLDILLVDDGSTDSSGEICDHMAQSDNRIRVFHTKNGGLSAARNKGLGYAIGDFVLFVDSDDYIGSRHVEQLLNSLGGDASRPCVAITGYTVVSSVDESVLDSQDVLNVTELSCAEALRTSVSIGGTFASHAWGKLYSSDLAEILHYPERKYFEDQYVTYKVFLSASRIVYADANDYFYMTDRQDSISNLSLLNRLDYLEAIRETCNCVAARCPEAYDAVRHRYQNTLLESCLISIRYGDKGMSIPLFREMSEQRPLALRTHSLSVKTRLYYLATLFGHSIFRLLILRGGKNA